MTPKKALSIIKEANPLYYMQRKGGETVIKPDNEFIEAVKALEERIALIDAIERENGIAVEILFKALKDGIWSKGGFYDGACYLDAKPNFIPPNELEIGRCWYKQYDKDDYTWQNEVDEENAMCLYTHDYESKVRSVRIKDYGKTWALTKEELL